MKRRTAIQHIIIIGAGASVLASCLDKPSVDLKYIPLTGPQEDLLAAITQTIIPSTDFVGAKELESHKFLLMMADDCTSPADQKKFMDGLKQFDEACRKKYSSVFVKCIPEQREEFLLAIESKPDFNEDVIGFYQSVKWATIESFTTSEAYLTKVKNFSLIPGSFKGCVPVENV